MILHTLGLLKAIDFREFGQITVLINGDEEISSPAARALFAQPPLIPGMKLAMNFEVAPSAAGVQADAGGGGHARAVGLSRDRPRAQGREPRRGWRNRRGVRRAEH